MSKYIGMIWPSGDSAKLRGAAAAWTIAGTNFEVNEILGATGPMTGIGAQQIPEGPAIAAAFAETHRCAAGILRQCAAVATHLTSYATKIDTVHAAIIDLLSRICNPLTGIKEVWEFLTDEDEDEIKKIANDIRVIVNQFTAEVDALRQQIATAFAEAKTILGVMTRYADKEWDHFLHTTEVGRALDHFGQICAGVFSEAESTVKGIWTLNPVRLLVDPKGFWHSISGSLEKLEALSGLDGEQKFAESWKDLGKDLAHWDEWSINPFKAAGETAFDVGTFLLPGGAAVENLEVWPPGRRCRRGSQRFSAADAGPAAQSGAPRQSAATERPTKGRTARARAEAQKPAATVWAHRAENSGRSKASTHSLETCGRAGVSGRAATAIGIDSRPT